MNEIKCLCGCNESLSWSGQGRRPKFLNDAHRKSFNRTNKIKPLQEPTSQPQALQPEIPPTEHLPDKYSHLDQNPFSIYPPHIAPYMPQRSDLNISLLIQSKPIPRKPIENPPW